MAESRRAIWSGTARWYYTGMSLELGRRGTGRPLTAQLVEFSQPMGDVQALEAYFGCRIRMGANRNRLTLYRRDLDRPLSRITKNCWRF